MNLWAIYHFTLSCVSRINVLMIISHKSDFFNLIKSFLLCLISKSKNILEYISAESNNFFQHSFKVSMFFFLNFMLVFIFTSKKMIKGLTVETKLKSSSESHCQVGIVFAILRTFHLLHSIFQHQSCLFHTIVQWTNIFCSIFLIHNIAFCFHLVLVLSLDHCSFQSRTDSTIQQVFYNFATSSATLSYFHFSSDKISDFNCL